MDRPGWDGICLAAQHAQAKLEIMHADLRDRYCVPNNNVDAVSCGHRLTVRPQVGSGRRNAVLS